MSAQTCLGNKTVEWPYPIKYNKINRVETDVLIIGGGLAGSCAGIAAARRGQRVAVIDKAPIKRSGCGGAGLDHWNGTINSPTSPFTPEEYMEQPMKMKSLKFRTYIDAKGNWEALMELEKMGLPIRDKDGNFESSSMMEESGILRCFDYTHCMSVRLRGGHYIKPVLYDNLKKEGAKLYERVMFTKLLTEKGLRGKRVVGAMGVNMQTGEIYVFCAKAVVLATGPMTGNWIASTELTGNSYRWDPNNSGEGLSAAWEAGAELTNMSKAGSTRGGTPFAWPRFGVGNPDNTWNPCTLVDNNGKVIPWENVNGETLESVDARHKPANGQSYIMSENDPLKGISKPLPTRKLVEGIKNGEYELPLWADISSMPEDERRAIWGLMIGNEGKTRFTLYDYYTRLGFDPKKDMLWVPIMPPEQYGGERMDWFQGEPNAVKPWRTESLGGNGSILVDWNLQSTLPGLFAAGAIGGISGCAGSCTAGFYAGNRAAEAAAELSYGEISEEQVEAERKRILNPVERSNDFKSYVSWKELWIGIARVMQVCCGEYKSIPILEEGLFWLESIRNSEAQLTYARNPHELARVLECENRIVMGEIYMHACIEKIKAETEQHHAQEFQSIKLNEKGKVERIQREEDYWLKPPYESTYLANYEKCRAKEREEMRHRERNTQ